MDHDFQASEKFVDYSLIQNMKELMEATALVRVLQPKAVVELGVYRGGTLYFWTRAAAPDARIVGVDTPGTPESVNSNLQSWLLPTQQGKIILADTKAPETRDQALDFLQRPIDFLFIDAEHTYESAKRDWELWSPCVRPGGLVMFHDISHRDTDDPSIGVYQLWAEIKAVKPTREIMGDPAYGIGVVFL